MSAPRFLSAPTAVLMLFPSVEQLRRAGKRSGQHRPFPQCAVLIHSLIPGRKIVAYGERAGQTVGGVKFASDHLDYDLVHGNRLTRFDHGNGHAGRS